MQSLTPIGPGFDVDPNARGLHPALLEKIASTAVVTGGHVRETDNKVPEGSDVSDDVSRQFGVGSTLRGVKSCSGEKFEENVTLEWRGLNLLLDPSDVVAKGPKRIPNSHQVMESLHTDGVSRECHVVRVGPLRRPDSRGRTDRRSFLPVARVHEQLVAQSLLARSASCQ